MSFDYHSRLTLRDFTTFHDATLEFVPGLNVIIGENGSGKTHILKALYAWQTARHLADNGRSAEYARVFADTYGARSAAELQRASPKIAEVSGRFGNSEWSVAFQAGNATDNGVRPTVTRPVFIPAIDMMAHARNMTGILRDYADFDRTCFDFVSMVTAQPARTDEDPPGPDIGSMRALLPGAVEWDDEEQRFHVDEDGRRMPFALAAEGVRKVAALQRLVDGGWLRPGGVLLWDEPEASVNPVWIDEIVEALVALVQHGVQVFVATHNYVVLKQTDLTLRRRRARGEPDTPVRFVALQRQRKVSRATWSDHFSDLDPNAILDQYDQMLDEDLRLADLSDGEQ